ncbi:MAG: MFS transporter [Acidimicrobiales bacterium]
MPPRGRRPLEARSRRLLTAAALANAGFAVSSVFLSLFFYVASGHVADMALFALGRYAGLAVVSVALAAWAPSLSPRRLVRLGVVATAVFYLVLIVTGRDAASLAVPLGLFNGAASGLYWFGANTAIFDVVAQEERGRYYGLTFGLLNALNVVGPLGAGVVVAMIGGLPGYLAVFGAAGATFLAAWWTARALPEGAGVGGMRLGEMLRLPLERPRWAAMWTVVFLRGFKQAAGSLGLVVLVALVTQSSLAQGEFAAVSALAAVGTSVLAGHIAPERRARAMWLGAIGFVAATGLLWANAGLVTLLAYGIATGLVYPAVMVPVASVILEAIDADPEAARRRGGYVCSRELAVNSGRVAAVILLLGALSVVSPRDAVLVTVGVAALSQLAVAGLAGAVSSRRLALTGE